RDDCDRNLSDQTVADVAAGSVTWRTKVQRCQQHCFERLNMDWLSDPQIWASLLTLTALEIVLGIDNLVFITILAGRLPPERQNRGRQMGWGLALTTRLALLASIAWIVGLTQPLIELFGHPVSWRDIILISGGLFLLYKGTREIHHRLEGDAPHE